MIDHVYRIRTDWDSNAPHCAERGSLVVILSRYPDGNYRGQALGCCSKVPMAMEFRPCDLKRLPCHEEINS